MKLGASSPPSLRLLMWVVEYQPRQDVAAQLVWRYSGIEDARETQAAAPGPGRGPSSSILTQM